MRIISRSLAFVMALAVLAVGSSPCPQSAQDALLAAERVTPPGASLRVAGHSMHMGHGSEMQAMPSEELGHDQAAHRAKLHAYCTCGCSDNPDMRVPGYRLGAVLLDMQRAPAEVCLENAGFEQVLSLPVPPVMTLEHVPLPT